MSHSIALLAPSSVPFQIGGAEQFWWGLHQALLRETSASVDLIKIPSHEASFQELVSSYKTFSQLNLDHFDMVITSKYPAWMVAHRNHVLYMQHTMRGLYDTYALTGLPPLLDPVPTPLLDLMARVRTTDPNRDDAAEVFELLDRAFATKSIPSYLFALPGPLLRETIHFFDRVALAPSQIAAYAAISATVAKRAEYFPASLAAKDICILHHPSNLPLGREHPNSPPYLFTASRLNGSKRLNLLIEAMRSVTHDIELRIAGTGPDKAALMDLAAGDRRIVFLGYMPDELLADAYANAFCVLFAPYDEDYGLITIEAMRAGKAVITTSDAGGVCEFVEHETTGLVADPNPKALGEAIQHLLDHPDLARAMGAAAKERVAAITWPRTVQGLLTHAQDTTVRRKQQTKHCRKVLVLSTFPLEEPYFGGQRRLLATCQALAQTAVVVVLCYGKHRAPCPTTEQLGPNLYQRILPWPYTARTFAEQQSARLGATVDDIALMTFCASDTNLTSALRAHSDADCILLSHPYLSPALGDIANLPPTIYDAHNVEADLKALILGQAEDLMARVTEVEESCVKHARCITCCTEEMRDRFHVLYEIPKDRCHIVPNGYDATSLAFFGKRERQALRTRLPYADTPLVLFLGSAHKPNIDAVFALANIAPSVPTVHFLLAGGASIETCVQHATLPPNVHCVGLVSEAIKNTLLHAVNLGVNPVTEGSGSNLKTIEYIAAGLPTVTTPFGARGLVPDVMAASRVVELDQFARAITDLLQTPMPESRLKHAAARARDLYGWEACTRELVSLLENDLSFRS